MPKLAIYPAGILLIIALLITIYWLSIGEIARYAIAQENRKSDDFILYSIYRYTPSSFSNENGRCVRLLFRDSSVGGTAVYCKKNGHYSVTYEGE